MLKHRTASGCVWFSFGFLSGAARRNLRVDRGSDNQRHPISSFSQTQVSVILPLAFNVSSLIPFCSRNFSSRDIADFFSEGGGLPAQMVFQSLN